MGSNTPIEFLLADSDIELMTLYVVPDAELPAPLPDHDVAIVIASDSEECRDALRRIERGRCALAAAVAQSAASASAISIATNCIGVLDGIEGLEIPATIGVDARATARELSRSAARAVPTSQAILPFR